MESYKDNLISELIEYNSYLFEINQSILVSQFKEMLYFLYNVDNIDQNNFNELKNIVEKIHAKIKIHRKKIIDYDDWNKYDNILINLEKSFAMIESNIYIADLEVSFNKIVIDLT